MERIQTETLIFMYLFSPRSKSSFPWQRNILAMVGAPRYMFGEAGTKQYLPSGCIFYVMQGMDVFSQHLGLTPGENPRGQCIPVPTEGQGRKRPQQLLECSLLETEVRGPRLTKCGRGHQLPWTAHSDVTPRGADTRESAVCGANTAEPAGRGVLP